ncbi:hypothetical protein ACP4OV_004207 [Aristida adscensionis]
MPLPPPRTPSTPLYPKYGDWSTGFETVQAVHPRGIPKSVARGGASVGTKNVKRWIKMLVWVEDFCEYQYYYYYDYEFDRHFGHFKSPFDRRPLVGRRPRVRKNVAKRSLRLVGSSDPEYIRQCEEAQFDDYSDSEDEEGLES